jgi:hypothetical protein
MLDTSVSESIYKSIGDHGVIDVIEHDVPRWLYCGWRPGVSRARQMLRLVFNCLYIYIVHNPLLYIYIPFVRCLSSRATLPGLSVNSCISEANVFVHQQWHEPGFARTNLAESTFTGQAWNNSHKGHSVLLYHVACVGSTVVAHTRAYSPVKSGQCTYRTKQLRGRS